MSFPILKSRYFWFVVTVAFFYKMVALVVYHYFPEHLPLILEESNLGENIAAAAWGMGGLLCLIKFIFFFGRKDVLMLWLWCFFAFLLGCTRELDMHKSFEATGGITWNVDWMADPAVSVLLKVIIILLLAMIPGGMLGSVAWKHRRIISELKAGNVLISVFILGMAYMAAGFLFDGSILGNKVLSPLIGRDHTRLFEESLETIAAVLACLAVVPFFYRKNIPLAQMRVAENVLPAHQ